MREIQCEIKKRSYFSTMINDLVTSGRNLGRNKYHTLPRVRSGDNPTGKNAKWRREKKLIIPKRDSKIFFLRKNMKARIYFIT